MNSQGKAREFCFNFSAATLQGIVVHFGRYSFFLNLIGYFSLLNFFPIYFKTFHLCSILVVFRLVYIPKRNNFLKFNLVSHSKSF